MGVAVVDNASSGAFGAFAGASDGELLGAVAQQDRAAFREFYDRYAGRLLAYVRAMGGSGAKIPAEDIVQEIFVAVWLKAGQYRSALGAPEAWLFTITRHKVVDIWRAQSPVVDVGETDLEALMEPCQPEDTVLRMSLSKALGRLPVEQRKPLELAYFGGLTYEETAERLGLPVGTLKSRIRSGLGLLKTYLGGET